MQRVPFETMKSEFTRVLLASGLAEDRARLCARVHAENSRDGVYSHGLNSFPGFVARVREGGGIDIHATPRKVGGFGALEQWDGESGLGILNATTCMERAVALAREHGIGCVALRNTNHWMRAGTYGLQAADAGRIGICWTNTTRLMPPHGSAERRIGNNPLVFAIPREGGHILLDMAISQFSGGKTLIHSRSGQPFPVPGGYDSQGNLTCDAAAIRQSNRPLPIGYWKGSGLAMALDLVAALASGGRTTYQIALEGGERGVSQTFIAIDIIRIAGEEGLRQVVEETIGDLHTAPPLREGEPVAYPGERMLQRRRENLEKGVPVDSEFWEQVLAL
ncbi:MAG: 3-dehydro-L-gulonate 2-dehydrogenase [Armatimonadetes bacterium]|nr:3-dehydro-L-gulonate 2-dehydrogenase [Armatimonadota bacterium]